MEFDMTATSVAMPGMTCFPDFPFAGGPRPWPIIDVETVQGNAMNVVSVQASAGLVNQSDMVFIPSIEQ